jgi:hypothetical protein
MKDPTEGLKEVWDRHFSSFPEIKKIEMTHCNIGVCSNHLHDKLPQLPCLSILQLSKIFHPGLDGKE